MNPMLLVREREKITRFYIISVAFADNRDKKTVSKMLLLLL